MKDSEGKPGTSHMRVHADFVKWMDRNRRAYQLKTGRRITIVDMTLLLANSLPDLDDDIPPFAIDAELLRKKTA